jgi:hypothetical protein
LHIIQSGFDFARIETACVRIRSQYKTPLGAHVQEVRFVSRPFSAFLQPAQNYNASLERLTQARTPAIIRAIASAKWKPRVRQTAQIFHIIPPSSSNNWISVF